MNRLLMSKPQQISEGKIRNCKRIIKFKVLTKSLGKFDAQRFFQGFLVFYSPSNS